jgi:hypothetical protein
MGSYLSLSIPLANESSLGEALVPVFGGSFFQPVAVGGIEGHSSGDHWFLAGYALEEFLEYWLTGGIPPPASIALSTSQDAELNVYQQQCADALKRTVPLGRLRSPFEQVDPRTGVTVLEPKHLSEEVLVPLTRWTARFHQAAVYVYGAIALAIQKPVESTWARAFQEVISAEEGEQPWPLPFLILQFHAADPFIGRRLVIRTQAHVWLRQAQALGGRVTPEDADANLCALASFARLLAHGRRSEHRAAELSLDGRFYTREESRIRAAFRELL